MCVFACNFKTEFELKTGKLYFSFPTYTCNNHFLNFTEENSRKSSVIIKFSCKERDTLL